MMHLSKNIRLIRKLSKHSQTMFGELFGVTKAMIVSYESGKAKPDELFVRKLAKLASVSENQLKNEDLSDYFSEGEKLEKLNIKKTGEELNARDKFIIDQQKEILELNAKVNVLLITLADIVSKVDKKAIALVDSELTESINREVKHLLRELKETLSEI